MNLLKLRDLGPTVLRVSFKPKNWGFEKWIDNNSKYCGKLLFFAAGKRCSIHYHKTKEETFYLHRGRMEIYFHDDAAGLEEHVREAGVVGIYDLMEKCILTQGEAFKIPIGRAHQMIALEDCELYEFSTEHDEHDSYRIVKGD